MSLRDNLPRERVAIAHLLPVGATAARNLLDVKPMNEGNPVVLLAEDDEDLRELVTARLKREGMNVIEVEDGLELRDYLDLCRPGGDLSEPDVVITDVQMPGESGPQTLARFSQLHAPVMLISGHLGPDERKAAAAEGVAAIFEKPFDLDQLVQAIRRVLRS